MEGKRVLFPASRLSLSEAMDIVLLFQLNGRRCFKWYCRRYDIRLHLIGLFPAPVRYNRFVELTRRALILLLISTQLFRRGKPAGVSVIGSTPLKARHNRRIYSHNMFKTCATRVKSSAGWVYGFKLHLAANGRGDGIGRLCCEGEAV
ncbi:MAG: hypothetical protein LBK73_03320 [Treponema sp.]|jgi:hypothetical protein|nr:hypothetical protein [Treponema sp.]